MGDLQPVSPRRGSKWWTDELEAIWRAWVSDVRPWTTEDEEAFAECVAWLQESNAEIDMLVQLWTDILGPVGMALGKVVESLGKKDFEDLEHEMFWFTREPGEIAHPDNRPADGSTQPTLAEISQAGKAGAVQTGRAPEPRPSRLLQVAEPPTTTEAARPNPLLVLLACGAAGLGMLVLLLLKP